MFDQQFNVSRKVKGIINEKVSILFVEFDYCSCFIG